ncbi:MAG: tetratricopeptide repeat protein, partial [Verrucomicrobia bacterium]|nr:tetratricopeptide repeat protein [Verrucomicrobiota bacterium]
MRVYGPEAGAAWLRVRRHLELGQGFAFIPVFVSEPFAAQLAREDLLGFLHGRREQLVEVPVDSPAALAGLSATLAGLTLPPSAGAIWVAAVPSAEGAKLDEWKGAWTRALARLNERRDVFRSRFDVPLLLVGPVWLQELCLRQAPDLWSVRTLVISLEPAATKDGDGFDAQLAAEAAMTSRHGTWHRQTLDPDYFEVHVVQPLRRKGPPEELVDSLLDLMQAQRGRGRRGEASATAEEAVGVARENAVSGSENARGQLAAALNAWSVAQSELGRRAEALALAQEAVELYRALARQNPDAFQPDLAGSLNNLAGFWSELGRRAEALAPAQEAVELYRALARQNPDAFQPDLAMSLWTL